jgi:hypothetical protein
VNLVIVNCGRFLKYHLCRIRDSFLLRWLLDLLKQSNVNKNYIYLKIKNQHLFEDNTKTIMPNMLRLQDEGEDLGVKLSPNIFAE